MSALDLIKGKKAVIFALLATAVLIAAYLFIGPAGQESEEVISKRVRLEVVEEPPAGQMEESPTDAPQGDIQATLPDAPITPAGPEGPAEIADRPSAVKVGRKEPVTPKSVTAPEDTPARTAAIKAKESTDVKTQAPRAETDKNAAKAGLTDEKPDRTEVKKKTDTPGHIQGDMESKKAVKKQPEKTAKKTKTVTAEDIAARPWAVGLASFKTLGEAQSVTASIKAMRHNAYITETVKDGRKWYRVRVGFYSTREEAEKIGATLSARFGFQSIWVVKPARDEAKAHFK